MVKEKANLILIYREPRGFSRVTAGFLSYDGEFRMPHVLAQGSPIFHSSCEGNFICPLSYLAQTVKRLPTMQETWVQSLGQEDREKEMATPLTPVFFPGKSHGWTIQVGYSPWGCKESDMTERLHFLDQVRDTVGHEARCMVRLFSP